MVARMISVMAENTGGAGVTFGLCSWGNGKWERGKKAGNGLVTYSPARLRSPLSVWGICICRVCPRSSGHPGGCIYR